MDHLGIDWAAEPDLEQLKAAYWLRPKDIDHAVASLEDLAKRGSIMSMVYLGDTYYQGKLISKNLDLAEHWYLGAAAAGSVFANYTLGTIYVRAGRYRDALRVLTVASNKECRRAAYLVARIYWFGAGVERDPDLAERYLEQAVELGSIPAHKLLGRILIEKKTSSTDTLRGLRLIFVALIKKAVAAISGKHGDH